MAQIPQMFRDSNYELVKYDGSPVQWRVSVYGLCIINDSLLLIKQKGAEFYDVPGGGVELDETLPEALLREGREEAGWELLPLQPLNIVSDWFYHRDENKFYRTLQHYYVVSGKEAMEKPLDKRVESVQLVSFDTFDQYKIYPLVLKAFDCYKFLLKT